jgi:hypothetical protein
VPEGIGGKTGKRVEWTTGTMDALAHSNYGRKQQERFVRDRGSVVKETLKSGNLFAQAEK